MLSSKLMAANPNDFDPLGYPPGLSVVATGDPTAMAPSYQTGDIAILGAIGEKDFPDLAVTWAGATRLFGSSVRGYQCYFKIVTAGDPAPSITRSRLTNGLLLRPDASISTVTSANAAAVNGTYDPSARVSGTNSLYYAVCGLGYTEVKAQAQAEVRRGGGAPTDKLTALVNATTSAADLFHPFDYSVISLGYALRSSDEGVAMDFDLSSSDYRVGAVGIVGFA